MHRDLALLIALLLSLSPPASLAQLTELDLEVNQDITDEGLAHLSKLANLKTLRVHQTRVTADGVRRLQEALPNLRIHHDAE